MSDLFGLSSLTPGGLLRPPGQPNGTTNTGGGTADVNETGNGTSSTAGGAPSAPLNITPQLLQLLTQTGYLGQGGGLGSPVGQMSGLVPPPVQPRRQSSLPATTLPGGFGGVPAAGNTIEETAKTAHVNQLLQRYLQNRPSSRGVTFPAQNPGAPLTMPSLVRPSPLQMPVANALRNAAFLNSAGLSSPGLLSTPTSMSPGMIFPGMARPKPKSNDVIDLTDDSTDVTPARRPLASSLDEHNVVYGVLRSKVVNVVWDAYLSQGAPATSEETVILRYTKEQAADMIVQNILDANLGLVDKRAGIYLAQLLNNNLISVNATIQSGIPRSSLKELPLSVVVAGSFQNRLTISTYFEKGGFTLWPPSQSQIGSRVFLGVLSSGANKQQSYSSYTQQTALKDYNDAKNQLDEVYDAMKGWEDLEETEPVEALKTPSYPHQRQALTFMLQREKDPADREESLNIWKKEGAGFSFKCSINNEVRPKKGEKTPFVAREVRGGIVADDMGLGKTIQILSLILSDPDRRRPGEDMYEDEGDGWEQQPVKAAKSSKSSKKRKREDAGDMYGSSSSQKPRKEYFTAYNEDGYEEVSDGSDFDDDLAETYGGGRDYSQDYVNGAVDGDSDGSAEWDSGNQGYDNLEDAEMRRMPYGLSSQGSGVGTPRGTGSSILKISIKPQGQTTPAEQPSYVPDSSYDPSGYGSAGMSQDSGSRSQPSAFSLKIKLSTRPSSPGLGAGSPAPSMPERPVATGPPTLKLVYNSAPPVLATSIPTSTATPPPTNSFSRNSPPNSQNGFDTGSSSALSGSLPAPAPVTKLKLNLGSLSSASRAGSPAPSTGTSTPAPLGPGDPAAPIAKPRAPRSKKDDDCFYTEAVYKSPGTLIICPLSTVSNWEEQIQQHCEPNSIWVYVHHGNSRKQDLEALSMHDVVITTYNVLSIEYGRMVKAGSNLKYDDDGRPVYAAPLHAINWHRVVLDEAHTIKDASTAQSKAACTLNAVRRWCLTGTPIQNRLDDLYALIKFLRVQPFDEKLTWTNSFTKPLRAADPIGVSRLQTLMKLITIRRTKTMKIKGKPILQLPPREDKVESVELGPYERKVYETMRTQSKEIFEKLMSKGTVMRNYVHVLEILLRLRQIVTHPALVKSSQIDFSRLNLDDDVVIDLSDDSAIDVGQCWDTYALLRESGEDGCCRCQEQVLDLTTIQDSDGRYANKAPVMTRCGHLYCKGCIEIAFKSQSVFSCNLCERMISQPDTIELNEASIETMTAQSAVKAEKAIKAQMKTEDGLPSGVNLDPSKLALMEAHDESAKVKAIIRDLLQVRLEAESNGEDLPKSVVFSQWTGMLDILEIHLTNSGFRFARLDGRMSRADRSLAIQVFRSDPFCNVMLVSLKAGGVGLNLTMACRAYLCEPYWNPSVENQAVDRIHRMGQTKPVTTIRLIVKNSVEDNILALQKKKLALANMALERTSGKKSTAEKKEELQKQRLQDLKFLFK